MTKEAQRSYEKQDLVPHFSEKEKGAEKNATRGTEGLQKKHYNSMFFTRKNMGKIV